MTALAFFAASGQPVLACTLPRYATQVGESDVDFKARIAADQDAARRYEELPARDRAAIDQASWWEFYPKVYVARVERISVNGRVYPAPNKPAPTRNGILPPLVPVPPPPVTLDSHKAWLRPIARLKGEEALPLPGWQEVGGQTSCGGLADGALGYSSPDELVIVFANEGALFGLALLDAAEPRLVAALRREGLGPRPLR